MKNKIRIRILIAPAAYLLFALSAASQAPTTTTPQDRTFVFTFPNAVSFTATVTSSAGVVNEGTVTFTVLPLPPLSAPVVNGVATVGAGLGSPPIGIHGISAVYSGTPNFSPSSGTATEIVTSDSGALAFVPVTPCRIADTRSPDGAFGGPELLGGSSRDFAIPDSACGIPSTAKAFSLNVTVVPDAQLNYLTIWPTGYLQQFVSTLNSDGRIKANATIVAAGTNGAVSVYVTDNTQLILDIDGYFVAVGSAPALAFYTSPPCRVVDTRQGAPPFGGPSLIAGETRSFALPSSNCNIPSNARAYSLNITAIPHNMLGYLTTWPTGQPQPFVSTLNAPTRTITANAAIVPAGTNGEISVYVTDATDLIIDINGYLGDLHGPQTALWFYLRNPFRALDTRLSSGQFTGNLSVQVPVTVYAFAQGCLVNATVVPPGPLVYLTLGPSSSSVSSINALDGAITSNMALVQSVAQGYNATFFNAFASDPTQLILDVLGYIAQ